jgi:hypothetical protein
MDVLRAENERLRVELYLYKNPPTFLWVWERFRGTGNTRLIKECVTDEATRAGLKVEEYRPDQEFTIHAETDVVCCTVDCHIAMRIDEAGKLYFALGSLVHEALSVECAEFQRTVQFLRHPHHCS